jgi:hypothetical protein
MRMVLWPFVGLALLTQALLALGLAHVVVSSAARLLEL